MSKKKRKSKKLPLIYLVVLIIAFLLSALHPVNRWAWIGQSAAAVILVLVLVGTYRKFQFSSFTYFLVFSYILLLFYGAHYTYSQNPLFHWLKIQFGWQRNYFDRLGHFMQGLVPAFLFKEVYERGGYVKKGKMLSFIVVLSCLGFSAFYELSEFAAVKLLQVPAEAVMGMQGDFFDSHWDMLWALIGALVAVFGLGRIHDKQLAKQK